MLDVSELGHQASEGQHAHRRQPSETVSRAQPKGACLHSWTGPVWCLPALSVLKDKGGKVRVIQRKPLCCNSLPRLYILISQQAGRELGTAFSINTQASSLTQQWVLPIRCLYSPQTQFQIIIIILLTFSQPFYKRIRVQLFLVTRLLWWSNIEFEKIPYRSGD